MSSPHPTSSSPSKRPRPVVLAGAGYGRITGIDTVETPDLRAHCDMRCQARVADELTGWLATIPSWSGPLRVTLVLPDDTRPIVPSQVLPPLIAAVAESARRRFSAVAITPLVASGLHAPPPDAFMEAIAQALRPFRNDPSLHIQAPLTHSARDTEAAGIPLSPWVTPRPRGGRADCVITVGAVEPHQYAGFSGGSKALSIGCAATSIIGAIHSLKLLRQDGVAIGNVRDNPFRDALDRVAQEHAAPTFALSLVPDPSGSGFAGLFGSPGVAAWRRAVSLAQDLMMVPLVRRYDFAVLGVPPAKARNLYQASRALTYLALHPSPCVRPGGTLVVQAACEDGFGLGAGEQAFRDALKRGRARLLSELSGHEEPPNAPSGGVQRAYMLARALERYTCVLVGTDASLDEARRAGLGQVKRLDQVDLSGDGLWVDDPFATTPFYNAPPMAA